MRIAEREENEQLAAEAFSKQSGIFDEIYSTNTIVNYKRERVRNHLLQYLQPHSRILELNSGTGEDAVFLANQGHTVHATDISEGMQQQLVQKVERAGLSHLISNEICSFTNLKGLKQRGLYDHIFSNFGGLNCADELDLTLHSFTPLLRSGGVITLVILPGFCLWESLLVFKGKFGTAFRRWFSWNGVDAHIEGTHFKCWYYNPSYVTETLGDDYDVLSVEGLCTIVPPSYIEGFAEKRPKTYKFLKAKEDKLKSKWPWRGIGDYYIISLKKR